MYRYDEDTHRKKRLTMKLIRKNLSRKPLGLCMILAITTLLFGLPLVLVGVSELKCGQPIQENGKTIAFIGMVVILFAVFYAICIVRLWRIYRKRITLTPDTVVSIDRLDGQLSLFAGERRWRSDPVYELCFQNGGVYRGYRPIERDGVGDEFLIVCYADKPEHVIDLYRSTEYDYNPDAP